MRALCDVERVRALLEMLRARAHARHGIAGADADDIFQDSIVTYLLVNRRYPADANHFGLLCGIFHNKSLMFLRSVARRVRLTGRLAQRLRADRPAVAGGEEPRGSTLDVVVREETGASIRAALQSMTPDGRGLLLSLSERPASRLDTIAALGVNPNTFDSRLHSARLQLRRTLRADGAA